MSARREHTRSFAVRPIRASFRPSSIDNRRTQTSGRRPTTTSTRHKRTSLDRQPTTPITWSTSRDAALVACRCLVVGENGTAPSSEEVLEHPAAGERRVRRPHGGRTRRLRPAARPRPSGGVHGRETLPAPLPGPRPAVGPAGPRCPRVRPVRHLLDLRVHRALVGDRPARSAPSVPWIGSPGTVSWAASSRRSGARPATMAP